MEITDPLPYARFRKLICGQVEPTRPPFAPYIHLLRGNRNVKLLNYHPTVNQWLRWPCWEIFSPSTTAHNDQCC